MYIQNVIRFFYTMNINEFIDLLQRAKNIASHLALNFIRIDNVVYKLNGAITESSHNEFKVKTIDSLKIYSFSLSGITDKVTKLPMSNRLLVRFNNGSHGLAIEYNEKAEFIKDDKLTQYYNNLVNHVVGTCKTVNGELNVVSQYVITNDGEQLTMDEYHDKYKIFERAKQRDQA